MSLCIECRGMKKMTRSSPSLLSQDQDDTSLDEYEEAYLDLVDIPPNLLTNNLNPSTRSTPCLFEPRPPLADNCDWEDPWLTNMANSDSCLIGGTTPSQGTSPGNLNDHEFSLTPTEQDTTCMNNALKIEKDFMEYVLCFPISSSNKGTSSSEPKKTPSEGSTKVGLDHLDNLCKLMEQLSDLKETNVKLKRRVQYLEDLKTLHEIHREMFGVSTLCNSCVSEDEFAKAIKPKVSPKRGVSVEKSSDQSKVNDSAREMAAGLYRSKTTTHVDTRPSDIKVGHRSRNSDHSGKEKSRERSKSVGHPGHSKCKNKRPSRWSKVKEVLGIEKLDSSAAECQEQAIEEQDDDTGDFVKLGLEKCYRSDAQSKNHKEQNARQRTNILSSRSFSAMPTASPDDKTGSKKGVKTPWSRMKTIIQSRRDLRNPKSESSSSSSRTGVLHNTQNEASEQVTNGNRRNTRSSRKSSFTLQDLPKKHQSRDTKNNPTDSSAPRNFQKKPKPSHEEGPHPHQIKRQNSVSESCQHPDEQFCELANSRSTHTWQYASNNAEEDSKSRHRSTNSESDKAFDFSSKAISNCNQKDNKVPQSEDTNHSSCASATVSELLKELQQNLSEDFNKKLEEWEKYRHDGPKTTNLEVERKDSFGRFRKFSKPEKKTTVSEKQPKQTTSEANDAKTRLQKKDINCIEKELQKLEREIQRLSKEKEKFEKRALRLRQLKGTTEKPNEVLVKTSAGEFRFQGISDEFTRKLYEWETKKGVGPEFSTIALLDESLKSPSDSMSEPRECNSIPFIDTMSVSMLSTDLLDKPNYPKSKASSEPDLSSLAIAQKEKSGGPAPTMRSKSGDTLLATSNESEICSIKEDVCRNESQETVVKVNNREDNYCSLLEENMFLLDQLKDKEDICRTLQTALDRLDERTEKANRSHQEEMEKYREKLWEIHMSRPRDLQGSLQLISQLKMRIEELQNCGDKLKSDREKLEVSFKFHSEQQSRLANDLIRRMTELQDSGFYSVFNRTGCRRKWKKSMKCDAGSISRIQELSTILLQQAREMEESLAERTKQVCHLRWELLHRDMSAVLMQAALHRVTCQGPQTTLLPTWDMKRIKFKEFKAWSIDTTTRRQSEDTRAEDWLQDRLKQLSLTPYKEWTSIEFDPNDLMGTVHELKKEAIRMSSSRLVGMSDSDERKKTASCSADSEVADSDRNYDTGSAFDSRSSSFSSGLGPGLRGSHSDTKIYERSRSLSVRRNSSSSMSCVSGFDASESSSMHDSDRIQHFMGQSSSACKVRRKNRWPSRENVSSSGSSRSSGLEDDASQWTCLYHNEDSPVYDDSLSRQLQLKYCSLREADEENADLGDTSRQVSGAECLITPKPVYLYSEQNQTTGESPYKLLKSLMTNPTYAASTSSQKNPHDFSKATKLKTPVSSALLSSSHCTSAQNSPEKRSGNPSHLFSDGSRKQSNISHESSTYNSAESLEDCKYVTHKEKKLFSDIRSLAESCVLSRSRTDNSVTENADSPDSPKLETWNKSPDITQFKYKGTKGFGRTDRLDFMKHEKGTE